MQYAVVGATRLLTFVFLQVLLQLHTNAQSHVLKRHRLADSSQEWLREQWNRAASWALPPFMTPW
jgi:hypothetical protein